MADFTFSSHVGDDGGYAQEYVVQQDAPNPLGTLTNVAGALVSLALVVGIGVWGYKLLVRDVSGIPVVKAVQGDMRVLPEDPGGEYAQHQGLSVNAVAAEGTAARPADELRLAPKPVELTEDDKVAPVEIAAPAPQEAPTLLETNEAGPDRAVVAEALQNGNVDDVVAQLTAGVAPLADLGAETEDIIASVTAQVAAEVQQAEAKLAAVIDAPGVRQSLRPRKRPATPVQVVNAVATAAVPEPKDIDPATLPAGTRLAQLGAFDSAEVAQEQWDQLQTRFSAYMADKDRVVQRASSGGRVFYRLRAMGFEDLGAARRFCSALVAENADCIPVVTR
ncbi:SPOR domain-containing protein [Sulfitobacter sp. JB4-11]|uniref:SPOR domain-containing protein n=1 Tax=Sulfitobacter rhodophyticola TaxID=3238304 RepID=UPI003518CD96